MKRFVVFLILFSVFCVGATALRAQDSQTQGEAPEPKMIPLSHQDLKLTGETRQVYEIFLKIALLTDPKSKVSSSPGKTQTRIEQIVDLLTEAAGIASDEGLKRYLQALAADIVKKDLKESSALWMELKDQPLDFFVKYRQKQRRMDPYVIYYDAEATLALQPYRMAADRILDELGVKREYIDNLGRFIAPIQVARLLYAQKVRRFVLMAPSLPVPQKRPGFKLLVLRNVSDAYFEQILKPIGKEVLVGAWAEAASAESFFHFLVLQKICHYVGPVLVNDKSERAQPVAEALGKLLEPLEIVKSHVLAARSVSFLVKEKIMEKEKEKGMLALYVVYLVDKLRRGPGEKALLPYLVQFNILLSKGGIGYDIQKKRFYIDIPAFQKIVQELSSDVLALIQKGNSKAVLKFFDQYQEAPSELEGIFKRLSGLQLDVDIVTPNPLAN